MIARSFRYQLLGAAALTPIAALPSAAAPAPLVDTTAASPVTSVTREQLEKLPVGRRLEDLIRTCPSNTIPTISRQPDILIDGKPAVDLNCVQPADIEMIEVLKVHNGVRAEYGASPLAWDPVLVQGAQGYVNVLSRSGQLVHASREGRGTVRENISQGLPNWNANRLMGSWLNERSYFRPGIFPNVSTTGDWFQVGHFSQMLWPTTTTIGCARGYGMGSSWLVCRYNPGGNKDGKPVGLPLQAQQVASAPNPWIRPRPIGGDYGHDLDWSSANDPFDVGFYGSGLWGMDGYYAGDGAAACARLQDDIFADYGGVLLFDPRPSTTGESDREFRFYGLGLDSSSVLLYDRFPSPCRLDF